MPLELIITERGNCLLRRILPGQEAALWLFSVLCDIGDFTNYLNFWRRLERGTRHSWWKKERTTMVLYCLLQNCCWVVGNIPFLFLLVLMGKAGSSLDLLTIL